MASGFIILLLTTVAILPEVKSIEKVTDPREFPFIAIINGHPNPVTFGVLVTSTKVVVSSVHLPERPMSVTIQVGCVFLRNCTTPELSVRLFGEDMVHGIIVLTLFNDTMTIHGRPIPIGLPKIYTNYPCRFVASDWTDGKIYSIEVRTTSRSKCLQMGVNVPPGYICIVNPMFSGRFDKAGGSSALFCNGRLVGLSNRESNVNYYVNFMYDVTYPGLL
ncbi:uncharacterized protein [Fopius arisanus]|uniref:Uncharacterized protein n=1 Tax=Fopius arisanus TaxID=64838 RepID=A0A9R1TLM8_9HYME|nr:PREDICTED: uncharacterized protein LOC105271726 [Fopius arisanus]